MKKREELKKTMNSNVYKRIHGTSVGSCDYCMPHKGCNRRYHNSRSWKNYRAKQYKGA